MKINGHSGRSSVRACLQMRLLAALAAWVAGSLALAQGQPTITPNYKDADLGQIVEAVSEITGKNFIVDPRVRAQVTMLSHTPMTPDAFYQAFLAILQVHGFVAVPAGKVIKIIPDANARQVPGDDLPDRISSSSDEIVTEVIAVKNVSAAQLVPVLRPLIPQYGHFTAYPGSNMLIISDRANNVNRIMRIIQRIDQSGDEEVDVFPLEHASAAEVVRVVNALYPAQAAEGGAGARMVADERTNSVLISGEKSQRLRIKALVAHLDTPLESGGDTQVRYLRFADAEKLAAKLKEQATVTAATTQGAAAAALGAPPPRRPDRQEHHDLGRARDQCARHHRAAQGDAGPDVRHRQARHSPRTGAARVDPGRGLGRQDRRPWRQLGDRRQPGQQCGGRLHTADRRHQHRGPGARDQ